MFPVHRSRRLRRSLQMRELVRETHVHPEDLIHPLFVQEETDDAVPISSMPGQYRHSLRTLVPAVEEAAEAGVRGVMLFGIPNVKDPAGSQAYAEDGIVQRALRTLKAAQIPILLIADVCMCEYTSHGHCGHVEGCEVINDASLELLVKTAVAQAQAGADLMAPSDMMDGRVGAIRSGLDAAGLDQVAIMSYAAKYASAFYGPFREAAGSAPGFGDRSGYQMDPANLREALKEVRQDIEEGADMVMVKPALAYLDVIRAVREITDLPVAAYNVSGEYAMVELAARAGLMDRRRGVLEILTSIRRAGADIILTYHATEVARWLREG